MAIYVGEALSLTMSAKVSTAGAVIADGTVFFELFNPAKHPITVLTDRTPDKTVAAVYNSTTSTYVAVFSTAGFVAGKWTARGVITRGSDVDSWEYTTFTLKA